MGLAPYEPQGSGSGPWASVEASGAAAGPLSGHAGAVTCLALALAPDGSQLLASGGEDGCVRVWELRSGQPVKVRCRQGPPHGAAQRLLALHSARGPAGLGSRSWAPACIRAPVQVFNTPSREPVAALLALSEPAALGLISGEAAAPGPSQRAGARRLAPLAPLAKSVGAWGGRRVRSRPQAREAFAPHNEAVGCCWAAVSPWSWPLALDAQWLATAPATPTMRCWSWTALSASLRWGAPQSQS